MADLDGLRLVLVLATSTGGVGRHVASLAAGLCVRGAEVTVAGPAATEELFGFRNAGAGFTAVEIAAGPRPVRDARAAVALGRLLRETVGPRGAARLRGSDRPGLVHAHGFRAGLLTGLVRPAAVPLVITLHNVAPTGRRLLVEPLERLAVRRADMILAASPDLAERAVVLGARDVRLAPVAAPSLPPALRSAAEVRADLGAAGRPLLLAVGRLHPQKGLDVLIEAAALVAARRRAAGRPVPLVAIAGDGPAEADLRARIVATAAPVRLLGRRTDIADLLAAADVVLLPSRWEARALIAQEALLAGRPLVATAVGGLPDLLGDAAVLVPPDNAVGLAAAATQLLDDPTAAAALAERGRHRAAGWPTEATMLDQLTGICTRLSGRC